MLVQLRPDGEASGLDAERRAQALRADEDLPKARLKRVSSRPCWGLLLSLGFEPSVAYCAHGQADLAARPRAGGEGGVHVAFER